MLQIDKHNQSLQGYKFIDLFAGIGGFHYALKSFGAKCIFACEVDQKTAEIYYLNHKLKTQGDVTKIKANDIPKHDILCGGFPCQTFSISGKQKGFKDSRGTLFFDIARIVNYHKPKILFLENVKNFAKHNKGKTLTTVIKILNDLNYEIYYKILNTSNFGLPQNRERLYIIGFNHNNFTNIKFSFPKVNLFSSLESILENSSVNSNMKCHLL